MRRDDSCSPSDLCDNSESISSMKITAGWCIRATANSARTIFSPSPTYDGIAETVRAKCFSTANICVNYDIVYSKYTVFNNYNEDNTFTANIFMNYDKDNVSIQQISQRTIMEIFSYNIHSWIVTDLHTTNIFVICNTDTSFIQQIHLCHNQHKRLNRLCWLWHKCICCRKLIIGISEKIENGQMVTSVAQWTAHFAATLRRTFTEIWTLPHTSNQRSALL